MPQPFKKPQAAMYHFLSKNMELKTKFKKPQLITKVNTIIKG